MKIGTAKIQLDNTGKITKVIFEADIKVELLLDDLKNVKNTDEAGELALTKWFSRVENAELADRTKFMIKPHAITHDHECVIEYDLIEL